MKRLVILSDKMNVVLVKVLFAKRQQRLSERVR